MKTHCTLDPIEAAAKALDALLTAIDQAPSVGAVAAYKAAIARHGRELLDLTEDSTSLTAVKNRLRELASDDATAFAREGHLLSAWKPLIHAMREGAA